ncbi:MAG: hypothetical protein K6C35_04775 [Eubacterium sp.]|nr:hypothetical protein [Eubacterium sp.]
MFATGELLNQYITDSSTTKNAFVQLLGIDRSSFFQILKGKRLPTTLQLNCILNNLPISGEEKNHIRDVYLSEKMPTTAYNSRKTIVNLFKILCRDDASLNVPSDKDSTSPVHIISTGNTFDSEEKTTVLNGTQQINDFLRSSLFSLLGSDISYEIDIFVPISLLLKLRFFDTIRVLSMDERSKALTYKHILKYPAKFSMINNDIISDITSYISFLVNVNADYHSYYYYDPNLTDNSMGLLFPYYILLPDGILLLNSSCEKAVFTTDKILHTAYIDEYNSLKDHLASMTENIENIENTVPYLTDLPDETKTYYISYLPGLSYLATDELVDAFFPPSERELYKRHYKAFQHTDYKEFIAPTGILDIMNDGSFKEFSVIIKARGLDDNKYLIDTVSNRIGKSLFMADQDVFPISKNWSVYCIEHDRVIFAPVIKGKKSIVITEKNFVEAFTEFLENIKDDVILLDSEICLKEMTKLGAQ